MNGVLTRQDEDYIIISNGEDNNLSNILNHYYYADIPLHIKIANNYRSLLNEVGSIYLDRDEYKRYKYHVNGINIDKIIASNINNIIDITITEEKEDTGYGQRVYNS